MRAMPLRKALFGTLALMLVFACCLASGALAQKPTFSVSGQGTGLTRLNLILEPGSGMDRPALLQAGKAAQRALLSSGFFAIGILPPGQTTSGNWGEGQVSFPVVLGVEQINATEKRVTVEVMDGGIGRSNFRRQFQISGGTLLDIGYASADIIYEHFLTREGYFTSRVLYVREALDRGRKAFQIVSSDLFGEDTQVHVSSRAELTSPHISPDSSQLFYVAIQNDRPQIFRKTFQSGQVVPVFRDQEIRFSLTMDGNGNLYYSKSVNGNSDIYRLPPGSRQEERLTTSGGIETEPSVSDDGSKLAYVSDSSGPQRVVVQTLSNRAVSRAGTMSGRYGSPSWSPDGTMLALTRQSSGTFGITVQDMGSGEEKQISSSFFEENPAWARNGKVILFERVGRSSAETGLWLVDVEPNHAFRLPISGLPRDSRWVR